MFKPAFSCALLLAASTTALAAPGIAGCGTGSWIAGTTAICNGVLVYRDYIYDDYGAAGVNPTASSIGQTAGKVRYDTDADVNTADLVAVRLRVVGSDLHVSFELNSLFRENSTFAALAIDTDNDDTTGGGAWADLIAVEQPHGSGTGLSLQSSGWDQLYVFEAGDPDTNLIEGIIPLPEGTTWRVQAVTGIQSRRVVMNAGFRTDDSPTYAGLGNQSAFFDSEQATVLATTDISQWGFVVEVNKLLTGATEPSPPASGYHQRVYESDYTIYEDPETGELHFDRDAEGVSYAGVGTVGDGLFPTNYNFLGKYQPYGIYIPETGTAPHGLQMALHGAGQTHAALSSGPGMQQNLSEANNSILATPLGRGPDAWYGGISEKDVLDVMTDVLANYPIDSERVYSAGYSMGGYGAFRMATMYPHRFASFTSWVGATMPSGWPHIRITDVLKNTRQVPGAMLYGLADELVRYDTMYLPLEAKFLELGYESILYLHEAADHLALMIADDWRKEAAWAGNRTIQRQPKQVTYRTQPAMWVPAVEVVHDRAYWVSDIVGHNVEIEDYVDVDLITYACGGSLPEMARVADTAGPDPVPWTAQEFDLVDETPLNQANRLEGTVRNLKSLTIDVSPSEGACLGNEPIDYEITTDVAMSISFSDGREIDLPGPGTWTGSTSHANGNFDPVANDDAVQTAQSKSVKIQVLDNDTDANGDDLEVTAMTQPGNGTVKLKGKGTITYTPDTGFFGDDGFSYTVSDGRGGSDSATVSVVVHEDENIEPVAVDDAAETDSDLAVTIDVLSNDTDGNGDALQVTEVNEADHGSIVINADNTVTYSPKAGFSGEDHFGYTVSDGRGGSDSATVTITVHGDAEAAGRGRVHGSGHWTRGSSGKYDKIDFSFDARFYQDQGLKGKLKLHDKALDLKIDARTITSLSTGQGEFCDEVLLDGLKSFVFTAIGDLEASDEETENVTFRGCGVDNGKHGKGKDGQPADLFHVEVVGGGYSSGARTPDNSIDGGNVHLHDPIFNPGTPATADTEAAAEHSDDSVMVIDLDPLLVSEAPMGTPLVLVALASTPSGLALEGIPMSLVWATDAATGEVMAVTNAYGVATFTTLVPAGDVAYLVTSGELESNGVRVTGHD